MGAPTADAAVCAAHPLEPVIGLCGRCGVFVCGRDGAEVRGVLYCAECAGRSEVWQLAKGHSGAMPKRPRFAWRSFSRALTFARGLGLRSLDEWRAFCRGELPEKDTLPDDIPRQPNGAKEYLEHWQGWSHFLGTGRRLRRPRTCWRAFKAARAFARRLGVRSRADWEHFMRGETRFGTPPSDLPPRPDKVYEEWAGWGDWLGTGVVALHQRTFRSFRKGRDFARGLGLRSVKEWHRFCRGELRGKGKRPDDVPWNPQKVYRDGGWKGWGDWLGTDAVACRDRVFRRFARGRAFVRTLGLRSQRDWRAYCRGELLGLSRPPDIPAAPDVVYRESGWRGFQDWLTYPRRRGPKRRERPRGPGP